MNDTSTTENSAVGLPLSLGEGEQGGENLYTPNCARTVSGRYVNLIDPDPATFCIEDIAHALSNVPRFGGHLPMPWSVAHHSLLVASLVPQEHKLQALCHDFSEAFLQDLHPDLKAAVSEYKVIEERMMKAIAQRFGMPWPMAPEVKAADKQALEMEWKYIMLGVRNGSSEQHMITSRMAYGPVTVRMMLCKHVKDALAAQVELNS
jgi:hypothetical protein